MSGLDIWLCCFTLPPVTRIPFQGTAWAGHPHRCLSPLPSWMRLLAGCPGPPLQAQEILSPRGTPPPPPPTLPAFKSSFSGIPWVCRKPRGLGSAGHLPRFCHGIFLSPWTCALCLPAFSLQSSQETNSWPGVPWRQTPGLAFPGEVGATRSCVCSTRSHACSTRAPSARAGAPGSVYGDRAVVSAWGQRFVQCD